MTSLVAVGLAFGGATFSFASTGTVSIEQLTLVEESAPGALLLANDNSHHGGHHGGHGGHYGGYHGGYGGHHGGYHGGHHGGHDGFHGGVEWDGGVGFPAQYGHDYDYDYPETYYRETEYYPSAYDADYETDQNYQYINGVYFYFNGSEWLYFQNGAWHPDEEGRHLQR